MSLTRRESLCSMLAGIVGAKAAPGVKVEAIEEDGPPQNYEALLAALKSAPPGAMWGVEREAEKLAIAVKGGCLSRNEVRAEFGLPSLEGDYWTEPFSPLPVPEEDPRVVAFKALLAQSQEHFDQGRTLCFMCNKDGNVSERPMHWVGESQHHDPLHIDDVRRMRS